MLYGKDGSDSESQIKFQYCTLTQHVVGNVRDGVLFLPSNISVCPSACLVLAW